MNETQTDSSPVQHSATLGQLAAALAKFQGGTSAVARDKTVKTRTYSYSYADLASIIDATRETLAANELAVLQSPSTNGPRVTITTLLMHSSGEWVRGALTMTVADPAPQTVGSALSYARRYALLAMLGIATDDDDGVAASGPPNGRASEPAPRPPRQPGGEGPPVPAAPLVLITAPQQEDLNQLTIDLGITEAQLAAGLKRDFPETAGDWNRLTTAQASQLIDRLRKKKLNQQVGSPGGATAVAAGSTSAKA